ncbi:hypothetical protein PTKIN_Ptkin12aG0195900 [Pterospermum kingtungense]
MFGFNTQLVPSPSINRASLTGFHLVSAVSLLGAAGTRRFYYSIPNSQTQRTSCRAFASVARRAKQSLGRPFSWASPRKWTACGVVTTVIIGSCLCFFIFGGKIERVPYTNRLHYTLSDKLEKKFNEYRQGWFDNRDIIVPKSDPQVIRVESIARRILEAMNKELTLQHQSSESSRLLMNHNAPNSDASKDLNVDSTGQKLQWKPATKHLYRKDWEAYVVKWYSEDCRLDLDGKIVIPHRVVHRAESDAELATIIAHQIGHAVARHFAEGFSPLLLPALLFFSRRREAEADYIGLMLMASAGYDPQVAPGVYGYLGYGTDRFDLLSAYYPGKKRGNLLKKPKTMEKAKQIFEQVKAGKGVECFV